MSYDIVVVRVLIVHSLLLLLPMSGAVAPLVIKAAPAGGMALAALNPWFSAITR